MIPQWWILICLLWLIWHQTVFIQLPSFSELCSWHTFKIKQNVTTLNIAAIITTAHGLSVLVTTVNLEFLSPALLASLGWLDTIKISVLFSLLKSWNWPYCLLIWCEHKLMVLPQFTVYGVNKQTVNSLNSFQRFDLTWGVLSLPLPLLMLVKMSCKTL